MDQPHADSKEQKAIDQKAQRSRRGRKWSKIIVAVLLLYLIYPISVTLALSTGLVEKLLASEDLRVEISAPAWSLLPGDIHMGRVQIFMNGETQFILSADNLTAQIRLLPLFRRRFEVASLATKNVIFQMRVQLDEKGAASPRASAFPPLPGLPGDPTKVRAEAAKTEERSPEWTVRLDGIDAKVRELWFMEYRYLGDGRLQGGFERGPDVLRIDTSVQDLGPGQLRFGAEQIISKNFQGQVEAEIPKVDPSEHADTSFFEYVIAKVRLRADLETLAHVAAYVPGKTTVRGGAGPLDIRVGMQKGMLSSETLITFATPDVSLQGNGFGVKTDWNLRIGMGDDGQTRKPGPNEDDGLPHLRSTAQVTYVSVAARGPDTFTIQLQGHEETASLNSAKIGGDTEVKTARIHLPKIVTEDFDDLDSVVDKKTPFRTSAGRAEASLTLKLDERRQLSGPFRAEIDGATLTLDQLRARADGQAKFFVSLDPGKDRGTISELSVKLRDAGFRAGDETMRGWWLNLDSERIDLAGLPADHVRADLTLYARDAEPVIRALAEDGKVPGIVADIIHLKNLKVLAKVRKRGATTDIMVDTMESKFIDFSGRVLVAPKQTRMALLVGGKDIAIGIDKRGDHTGFQLLAGEDWLNERLDHFPKPEERVEGDKP
jgi:hypothetical protein